MQPPMIHPLEARTLFASPHFVEGPTFTDNGTTLTASGSVAGLGNEDVTVAVAAKGTATIVCRNPAGKVAPGQTQNVNVSGQQTITDVKNGRVVWDRMRRLIDRWLPPARVCHPYPLRRLGVIT